MSFVSVHRRRLIPPVLSGSTEAPEIILLIKSIRITRHRTQDRIVRGNLSVGSIAAAYLIIVVVKINRFLFVDQTVEKRRQFLTFIFLIDGKILKRPS